MCEEARPLTDLGHGGSIVFGFLLAVVAVSSVWSARGAPGLVHAGRCGSFVVGAVVSLANTPIT